MIEISKIKEAIEHIKRFYGKALYSKDAGRITKGVELLISTCQSIVNHSESGILPEEKEIHELIGQSDLYHLAMAHCNNTDSLPYGSSHKAASNLSKAIRSELALRLVGVSGRIRREIDFIFDNPNILTERKRELLTIAIKELLGGIK